MKTGMVVATLGGLIIGHAVHAKELKIERPHWVIIATISDRTTGQPIQESRLEGSELVFDDRAACQSILDKVAPLHSDHLSVTLTCRKVGPVEVDL